MGFGNPLGDPWDEPDKEDFDAVDETLLRRLLVAQIDCLLEEPTLEFTDIWQTAQWYLAFDIVGWESRRRQFAQEKVADESGKELSAVQGKVRDVYDARADRNSRNTAQELFEDDLEAIEQAYQSHLEVR